MTSQLNVDTIVDKAGSGGTNVKVANTSTYVSDGGNVTQNTVQGLAKAWCQLTGTGPTINDSYNLASVTDTGVGQRTTVWTNPFSNDDYAMAGGQSSSGGDAANVGIQYHAQTTASVNNLTFASGATVDDTMTGIYLGDLA